MDQCQGCYMKNLLVQKDYSRVETGVSINSTVVSS
jgi:hypothetical protein